MFKKAIIAILVLFNISVLPTLGFCKEFTVEDAYRALSKERIAFHSSASRLGQEDIKYLENLFYIIDVAVRLRVKSKLILSSTYMNFSLEDYNEEINSIIQGFDLLKAPTEELESVKDHIIEALKFQSEYIFLWGSDTKSNRVNYLSTYKTHELTYKTNAKILTAYRLIRGHYAVKESQRNVLSIQSYFFALDFSYD